MLLVLTLPQLSSHSGALAKLFASNLVVVKTQPSSVARSYLDMTDIEESRVPLMSGLRRKVPGPGYPGTVSGVLEGVAREQAPNAVIFEAARRFSRGSFVIRSEILRFL